MKRLNENSSRRLSAIGGLALGGGFALGILGAWFLPTWVLAVALSVAFGL